MKNFVAVTLALSVFSGCSHTPDRTPASKKPPIPRLSLRAVNETLSAVPGGYIYLSPNREDMADVLKFRLHSNPSTLYTEGLNGKDDIEFNQTVFRTDVEKYIAFEGAEDFVDAKRKFYSRLNFDLENQRHERTYPYLFDWKSLNHPPIRTLDLPLAIYVKAMGDGAPDGTSKYFDPEFQKELDEMSQTELSRGNRLTILANGKAQDEKLRQVLAAKDHILVAVMAIQCDHTVVPLIDAMIEKKREGVDVRVITEKFYTDTVFRKCYKRMVKGGLEVVRIDDKFKYKFAFMHNKFWIFDGKAGIIGGQNLAHFETLSDGFNHYNRDSDLLIEGPAVVDLLENYVDIWEKHVNKRFVRQSKYSSAEPYNAVVKRLRNEQVMAGQRGQMHYADWLWNPSKRMDGLCRIAIQRPYGRNFFIGDLYEKYFNEAKKHVLLTSPDMKFDVDGQEIKSHRATGFYRYAREAAARGVRVDQISNGRDGGWGEFTAQLREWSEEAEANGKHGLAKFWSKREEKQAVKMIGETREKLKLLAKTPNYYSWTHFQYIHAKQILWDNIVSVIGSVNLDNTALDRNHEGAAICMDESLTKQMRELLTLDIVNSVPVISKNGK